MVYGLHTKELPRRMINKMDTYMYKHLRIAQAPTHDDEPTMEPR